MSRALRQELPALLEMDNTDMLTYQHTAVLLLSAILSKTSHSELYRDPVAS